MNKEQEWSEYETRIRAEVKEAVKQIFRYINGPEDVFTDALLAELQVEHRTLQQGFFRVVKKAIEQQAKLKDSGYYDLRNEASVLWAKKCVETDEFDGCQLPLI